MPKTSFTVHLDDESAKKIADLQEINPGFSRNALIRMVIREHKLYSPQKNDKISDVEYTILQLQSQINALHKQLNPDWKRKKSLPYHFEHEYYDVKNYTEFHG